jgi:hypothetical protein
MSTACVRRKLATVWRVVVGLSVAASAHRRLFRTNSSIGTRREHSTLSRPRHARARQLGGARTRWYARPGQLSPCSPPWRWLSSRRSSGHQQSGQQRQDQASQCFRRDHIRVGRSGHLPVGLISVMPVDDLGPMLYPRGRSSG